MNDDELEKKLNKDIIEKLHSNQLYREAMRIAPEDEKSKISNAAEQFAVQFFSIINLANTKIQEEKEKKNDKSGDNIVKEEEVSKE
jgi:hypothetical protein